MRRRAVRCAGSTSTFGRTSRSPRTVATRLLLLGAGFVDLFTPSAELYKRASKPLTINGIHLNESGDKALAPVIDLALFGKPAAKPQTEKQLEALRICSTLPDVQQRVFH